MQTRFQATFNQIMENMNISSDVFGGSPEATQFSADTYAPGDARNLFGTKKKKKKKPFIQRRPLNREDI